MNNKSQQILMPHLPTMNVIISYFTDEEYTIVLKQFNTFKDRSIKNKEENIKKEKDDYYFQEIEENTLHQFDGETEMITVGQKHFFSSPLETSPRFDDRINQFLNYHLSKKKDTKPFKEALQSHGIHSDEPMAGESIQDALIRTLLTKVPMEPLASIQIANTDVIDSLVMFDRGGFYTGDMKNNASKFHKEQSDRIGSLKLKMLATIGRAENMIATRKMIIAYNIGSVYNQLVRMLKTTSGTKYQIPLKAHQQSTRIKVFAYMRDVLVNLRMLLWS
jgi:hypothetical protein